MRHTFPLALGAAIIASTLTIAAQTPNTSAPAPKNQAPVTQPKTSQPATTKTATMDADHHFAMDVAQAGMAEVELGQMAADKATNAKVKEFSQRMVTDHGKGNDELKSIASSKNITLPAEPNAKQKATKDRLSKLSGVAFDRAYMAEMVKDHQAASALFKKEASTGKDAEIKAFASKTAPTIDEHLKMARDIQKEVGAAKSTE